ncbi:DUF3043 domain-containing protein [Actinoallomurus iriomotensis]|uniref:DUF3043 domain-containing protein n=1 Tax=Actinoallomurus iriomotensis TaxID=478107 RepID=A0A9W6RA62_9ACTN|nr:DUF3043 domain-containing protein [Actinoallomurus iriomotensis]GLY72121.1 hypothetical protein Airi01_003880 [Actinoallomurus iriomotensis]
MFRRRTETATEEPPQAPEADSTTKTVGKGRPTPKRRDAEKRNRQPITAPRTRREALARERRQRTQRTGDAKQIREGIARGDDRYLPRRDKGPVRKLARDYVDARRTFGEFFMYLTILSLVASMAAPLVVRIYLQTFALPAILLILIVESLWISSQVKKLARERHPEESTQGVGFYAAARSLQIRRLRMPQPRLKPGQKAQV